MRNGLICHFIRGNLVPLPPYARAFQRAHTKRGNPLPAFLLLLRQRLVNDHEFTTAMQTNCVVVAAALDATTHRRRRHRRRHQATARQDGCGARWRA
jgi:hypothetical protein